LDRRLYRRCASTQGSGGRAMRRQSSFYP
ncbi:MAG: hypothetical protein GWN58_53765, partial [Anaerolineae bacterium]|nr:hypothetical protein [Anaerolineae bacterium]